MIPRSADSPGPPLDKLHEKLKDPGFTPALRDAASLLDMLAEADDEKAKPIERALARLGSLLVPATAKRLPQAPPRLRTRAYRLLAHAAPEDEAAARLLIAALFEEDARARRSAANALGRMHALPREIERALVDALERESEPAGRRAVAAALGKVGGPSALAALNTVTTEDPELSRITSRAKLMALRGTTRGEKGTIDAGRAPASPSPVVLRCRRGLEKIVRDEAVEKLSSALSVSAALHGEGLVRATLRGPLSALFEVRTMSDVSFEIARQKRPSEGAFELEDFFIEALSSPRARSVFETWTKGPVRFRVGWGGGGHRRAVVWRVAQVLSERRPEWINDPTESTWEALLYEEGGHVTVELSPRALVDPRFTYRERDVPASSYPPLAAALVRIAGLREEEVVWDPFVGSGTELVERSLQGRYRKLYGSDIEETALAAARTNFEKAGLLGVTLACADALKEAPARVTSIVTNPPMGRRVARGTLAPLLDGFIDHAAAVLKPGGRLTWLSPMPARTKERATQAGLRLTSAGQVDMGGFNAELQRFEKT